MSWLASAEPDALQNDYALACLLHAWKGYGIGLTFFKKPVAMGYVKRDMYLWRVYVRALRKQSFYVLIWLTALGSLGSFPRMEIMPSAEAKIALEVMFFFVGYLLVHSIDPKRLLALPPFLLGLPDTRERLSLVVWVALTGPLLALLWPLYGFSLFWVLHTIALLEISLLANGSFFAWVFLPLPVVSLMAPCPADRWPLFLLLGLPYLTAGGMWMGRWLLPSHWKGFRYTPRHAFPVVVVLFAFELYQRSMGMTMRFHLGNFFGLEAPNFEDPFLTVLLLLGGILFMLLPFLNLFGLRQAEESLTIERYLNGTPWSRRLRGLFFALCLNIPPALVLLNMRFVSSSAAIIFHFM
ncbi:MAG: hypothetical protein ACP5QU_09135 [Anaerolineae bacterium]